MRKTKRKDYPELDCLQLVDVDDIDPIYKSSITDFLTKNKIVFATGIYQGFYLSDYRLRISFRRSHALNQTYGKIYIVIFEDETKYYICQSLRECIRWVLNIVNMYKIDNYFDAFLMQNPQWNDREFLL